MPCCPVSGVDGGSAEKVALSGCHSDGGYRREFCGCFDAFGDDGGSDLSGELGHGRPEGVLALIFVDSGDEGCGPV